MDEGTFRVLRSLVEHQPTDALSLAKAAGEAPSVLRALRKAKAVWFRETDRGLSLTEKGLFAFSREVIERDRGQDASEPAVLEELTTASTERGRVKRELDQVWAAPETVVARAKLLISSGDVQRGLCFLGDDDMTSLATHLLGAERQTTVVDIDPELLELYDRWGQRRGWDHRSVMHDLREPIPKPLRGRFGCVFTDPPYAPEGFALFVSRAIDLCRPDGRLYVSFGASRRSPERGLEKQRLLARAGLLVEAVWASFNRYEGAASIGGVSDLWRLQCTPQTRALVHGREEREIYTRREPSES